MKPINDPIILLDSDVIRHFLSGKQIDLLPNIFPNRFAILDKVKNELCRSAKLVKLVNNFLINHKIPIIPFPRDLNIIKEYSSLRVSYGEGESACMAVAKYQKKYIASSNIKDIRTYCVTNNIIYYTTMDLLLFAYESNLISEAEADYFIYNVRSVGSKLPCNSISEFKNIINKHP